MTDFVTSSRASTSSNEASAVSSEQSSSAQNSNNGGVSPDDHLDLRRTPCPINFVRTKLHLEKMPPGSLLKVWLDPGEPIEQVPDSLTMEGYSIEQIEDHTNFFVLSIRRPNLSV